MTSPDPQQLADYEKAQHDEWFEWVAVGPIYAGAARAYNEGDPVPASNVERLKYEASGLVVKRKSAEGKRILEATGKAVEEDHAADVEAQAVNAPTKATTRKANS